MRIENVTSQRDAYQTMRITKRDFRYSLLGAWIIGLATMCFAQVFALIIFGV